MATRTSTQTGNFNSTATWGGSAVPVDGDQFVVSAGHTVTISDDRRPTNGYGDSTVNGKLVISGTGQLRMNGTLFVDDVGGATTYFTEGNSTSGAYFGMSNGAILEIKGDNTAQHRLQVQAGQYIECILDGTNPNASTTLSSSTTNGDYSIAVASSTGFVANDWISVQLAAENIDDYEQTRAHTEGFRVHDVSGNNIYLRQYISPTATITAASGTSVTVDNAKVFRQGNRIIFGTGSNRNTKEITAINYVTNVLTIDTSIVGSVVGQTVYQSGTEKKHLISEDVQKIATTLTADASSGQAVIAVASTAGMGVGDRLLIDANNTADTNWDYENVYEISAINGNNVTLTANLANNRLEGGYVVIYERETQIRSTDIGNSNERPFVWVVRGTGTNQYYRRIRFRNILFDGLGRNTNSTYYNGVAFVGYASYENNNYGQFHSSIEGCVYRANSATTYAGFMMRDAHQCSFRNNVMTDTERGLWRWSSGNNTVMTNNFSTRSSYATYTIEGLYEPYTCFEYNFASRSDDYGALFYNIRDGGSAIRHCEFINHEQRPQYVYYNEANFVFEKMKYNGYRYMPYKGIPGADLIYLNSHFGNTWDITGDATVLNGIYVHDDDYSRPFRASGEQGRQVSINHQFEIDETVDWGQYVKRTWTPSEGAWRNHRTISTSNSAGVTFGAYVPANSTVYLGAEIKMTDGFSGNYPYFLAYADKAYHRGQWIIDGTTGTELSSNSGTSPATGFQHQVQFTSATLTNYEQQTITISPQKYDYYLTFAVYSNSTNAGNGTEGWYQKPIKMTITNGSGIRASRRLGEFRYNIGSALSTGKTRLGGRLS